MVAVFYHHCCLTEMWTSKTGARRSPHDLTVVPTGIGQAQTSALGHKPTCREVGAMSSIPPKADIRQREWHVRLVPKAELFYSPDGGAGHGWSGVMIFTMPLTKFQTATASALELTMTTIVVFSEGR